MGAKQVLGIYRFLVSGHSTTTQVLVLMISCPEACGDFRRTFGEQCDDGNNVSGDGCSALCDVEPGGEKL